MTIIAAERLRGITDGQAVKAACVCATTANITLSGLQTIDGISVLADYRVLVKDQTTASENGIYVASTGTWTRAYDFDGDNDIIQGTRVFVVTGTTNAATEWYISTSDPAIGSSLAFTKITVESVPAPSSGSITLSGYTQTTARLLGRTTAATGAIEEITVGTGLSLSAGSLTNALVAGTHYVVPGAVTANGITMSTARILGRTTAATGAIEEITIGAGLSLSAGTLSNTVTTNTGGKTLIASGTLSGTTQSFTNIVDTYAYLVLQITGMSFTTSSTPTVRLSTNNGSSYDSTAANYSGIRTNIDGVPTVTTAKIATASMLENGALSGSTTENVTITIRPYQGGTYTQWTAVIDDGTNVSVVTGVYKSTSAINALQIAGGTFDGGTYALYGVS